MTILPWLKDLFGIAQLTPCPYCDNPDRDFWTRDPQNLSGDCKFDVAANGGADAPCICDNYGTSKGY